MGLTVNQAAAQAAVQNASGLLVGEPTEIPVTSPLPDGFLEQDARYERQGFASAYEVFKGQNRRLLRATSTTTPRSSITGISWAAEADNTNAAVDPFTGKVVVWDTTNRDRMWVGGGESYTFYDAASDISGNVNTPPTFIGGFAIFPLVNGDRVVIDIENETFTEQTPAAGSLTGPASPYDNAQYGISGSELRRWTLDNVVTVTDISAPAYDDLNTPTRAVRGASGRFLYIDYSNNGRGLEAELYDLLSGTKLKCAPFGQGNVAPGTVSHFWTDNETFVIVLNTGEVRAASTPEGDRAWPIVIPAGSFSYPPEAMWAVGTRLGTFYRDEFVYHWSTLGLQLTNLLTGEKQIRTHTYSALTNNIVTVGGNYLFRASSDTQGTLLTHIPFETDDQTFFRTPPATALRPGHRVVFRGR